MILLTLPFRLMDPEVRIDRVSSAIGNPGTWEKFWLSSALAAMPDSDAGEGESGIVDTERRRYRAPLPVCIGVLLLKWACMTDRDGPATGSSWVACPASVTLTTGVMDTTGGAISLEAKFREKLKGALVILGFKGAIDWREEYDWTEDFVGRVACFRRDGRLVAEDVRG